MPTINQLVRKGRERATNRSDSAGMPPEARRVPERQDTDAQEAQFRSAENRENPPDELHRRYLLYPGYRPQPAGAQRCAYPRRPCAGSARCSWICPVFVITSFAVLWIPPVWQSGCRLVPCMAQSARRSKSFAADAVRKAA